MGQSFIIPVAVSHNVHNITSDLNNSTKFDLEATMSTFITATKIFDGDLVDPQNSSSKWVETLSYYATPYESLVFSNYMAHIHNTNDFQSYRFQENAAVHSQSRYYVTVQDLQLAPDILDLYAKWNLLVRMATAKLEISFLSFSGVSWVSIAQWSGLFSCSSWSYWLLSRLLVLHGTPALLFLL